ncbi:MAG: hypothetical protein LBN26_01035 [Christensenellaceae bacterium]|nr:hypothetical protein [Christensenellaceae bacterium]
MKRFACLLLALLTLLPLLGCSSLSGRQVCLQFLTAIATGNYADAYELIDSSLQSSDPNNKETSGKITKEQFIGKYSGIFDVLGITAVTYDDADFTIKEGDIFTTVTFTATYTSALAGDLTDSYQLVAVRAGGRWVVEWSPNLLFPDMQWGDTIRKGVVAAKRGEILADGQILAATVGTVSVYAVPSKISEPGVFSQQAALLLGMTEEQVEERLKKAYNDMVILKQMHTEQLSDVAREQLLEVPGIGIDDGNYGTQREYPQGEMLAHILGYVGLISAETVKETRALVDAMNAGRSAEDGLYTTDSRVGKLGLEQQYEAQLRGKDGYRIFINTAQGTNRRTIYTKPVQDGYDLHLGINMALQKRLDFILQCELMDEATGGAVVVMNPKTGRIEAMSSWPSYDLNLFARGISSSDYNNLISKANTPLYNRLTQGLYPPGSVFKAFTAAAALDTQTLDENYVFTDKIADDYWLPSEFGTWLGSKIKRATVNHRYLTPLNMRSAIVYSDNIYFANASLLTGWDNFEAYLHQIGLSDTLPFDLNVARAQLHNKDTELSLMLLAESGYGQGEILTTPLQMATLFCAFANDGDVPTPYLVEGMYAVNGIKYDVVSRTVPKVWKRGIISQHALEVITPYLKDVVIPQYNGTGRSLGVTSYTVAAKTGTAEIGNDKSREISWFAGFRADAPQGEERLVLVMLEIPANSVYSSTKFTIARELLKKDAP